jgi:hypothetical protein
MKIAPYDETAFHMDHPRGTVAFNYLLMGGEPDKLENFRYILGRQEGDFHMRRHRHTFEQIRLPLVGDMNLGEQGILHEGEIGYFPEGQTYGPQDDPLSDPKQLQLVLQFGGSSGLGMGGGRGRGPDARRDGAAPRRERRDTKFPRARYQSVLIMNPDRFNWLAVPGETGVQRKFFGAFSERAFWIEYVKIDSGAQWSSTTDARRLIVALSGEATVEDTKIGRLAAIQVEEAEELTVRASEETVLYVVGLPPIQLPAVASDQFDLVTTDGGIEFENARKRAQVL